MIKFFAEKILKLSGWQRKVTLPQDKKFILIGAPHTSNWDFPLALLCFWTLDIKIHWVAKIQMFRGPLHYFFTALGGIPVDRNASDGFVEQVAKKINQADEMALAIAPEGTRAKAAYWKTGFYRIALAADIPICFGYVDYENKCIGFEQVLRPTGDINSDMKIIAHFYQNIKGKCPQNQGPVQIRS